MSLTTCPLELVASWMKGLGALGGNRRGLGLADGRVWTNANTGGGLFELLDPAEVGSASLAGMDHDTLVSLIWIVWDSLLMLWDSSVAGEVQ